MRKLVVLIGLLVVSAGVPLAEADYLQWGVDATRMGLTMDAGPVRDDVAFIVELPGSAHYPQSSAYHPLIISGAAYTMVRDAGSPGLEKNGVIRVDLSVPDPQLIIETEERPLGLVSDGDHLFVLRPLGVDAYPLAGGEPVWSWQREPLARHVISHSTTCEAPPALSGGVLFIYCTDAGELGFDVAQLVAAIDAHSGEELWVRTWTEEDRHLEALAQLEVTTPRVPFEMGISVIGDTVFTIGRKDMPQSVFVQALDRSDGQSLWSNEILVAEEFAERGTEQSGDPATWGQLFIVPGAVTGTPEEVYFAFLNFHALDPTTGDSNWMKPLALPHRELGGGSVVAVAGDGLYVSSLNMLARIDQPTESFVWQRPLPSDEAFQRDPLLLAGDILYMKTVRARELPLVGGTYVDYYFYAIERETGEVLWRHLVDIGGEGRAKFAVGEGVMVITGADGTLRVLGSTPASLQPEVTVSTSYPGVGDVVEVDLSGTGAGYHGEPTEFRATWGDGRATPWQADPLLVHQYQTHGVMTAEFSVRNDAGQTATTSVTFDVGGETPRELNLLQDLFAPDNQNMTFGVLGILVAMSIAIFGVVHQKQRRGRLQREIDAADSVYEEGKNEPLACLRALKERKILARGLVVDGKLEEAQFALLRDHIDGLSRSLRVPLVEEEFAFLPGVMLLSLRKMMVDGRITRFERDEFLEKLAKAKGVTKTQKKKVEERLEAWFQEDAGK